MISKYKMETLNYDNRGSIDKIIEDKRIQSVILIESVKGAIRANHYHKTDWHYCFLLKGSMEYYEKSVANPGDPEMMIIRSGEGVYTGPLVYHAVRFLEDSTMLTLSPKERNRIDYENDLIRYELIK